MTGDAGSKLLRDLGRKDPTGILTEAGRGQRKLEKEAKRVRRAIGLRGSQKPKLLEPIKPDPTPTHVEIGPSQRTRPKGRSGNILAGRLNRRRQILSTKIGRSILQ